MCGIKIHSNTKLGQAAGGQALAWLSSYVLCPSVSGWDGDIFRPYDPVNASCKITRILLHIVGNFLHYDFWDFGCDTESYDNALATKMIIYCFFNVLEP